MKRKDKLNGVYGLVITPFKEDYEIDESGLRKEINHMIENGIPIIVPTASSGEFASLTIGEQKRVIEITIEEVNGKATVIDGTSSPCIKTVMKLIEFAKNIGVDAVMVLPPYYYSVMTDEIVYKWYKFLEKSNMDIIVYNNPFSTKYNIMPDVVKRLAELESVVGIKESHGNCVQFYQTARLVGEKIAVIEGMGEAHALETILEGAAGYFSGIAAFLPKLTVNFYKMLKKGNIGEARIISDLIGNFNDLCFLKGSCKVIAYYKAAMEYFGICKSYSRFPIEPITKNEKNELELVLEILKNKEENLLD
jgi:4-hydroxy-tetrahydrodipicolinate synthase